MSNHYIVHHKQIQNYVHYISIKKKKATWVVMFGWEKEETTRKLL